MWLLVGIWGSCFLWKRKQRNNTCGWQLKLSQKKTLLITETQLRPPATVVSSLLHPLMLDQIKMRPYYVPQQLLFLSCFIHLCYIRWKWDSTSPSNWCFFHIHIHQIRGKWDSTTCMYLPQSPMKRRLLCPLEPPESTKSTEILKIVLKKRIKNQELQ